MKRVIINADDFGLSPGVNRGIVEAFEDGVLSSTTMLVNLGGFDDAVARARERPALPVGIHLSLLWGAPIADPEAVPSLVDGEGRFPTGVAPLARRYFLGRLSPEHVKSEFRAQIRRFVASGLTPTHADTHKHVHCLPGIMEALASVTAEFGIQKVRCPHEAGLGPAPPGGVAHPEVSWKSRAKRDLIRFFTRGHRDLMTSCGIRTTDHFVGIAFMETLNQEAFRFILQNVASGVTEIMCHPGYADEESDHFSRQSPRRERELQGLLDGEVRAEVEANAIELISYREL